MSAPMQSLIEKYDIPGPRYTSYPTVPYWDSIPDEQTWVGHLAAALQRHSATGAALYVHIPFCRSLCTYCGCNTRITRSHSIVAPYIATLMQELDLYRARLGIERLPVSELHLGGGTPTFLTEDELGTLLDGLFARIGLLAGGSASIEVDPRVTTLKQIELLSGRGFRRLSLGVQDFDPTVQAIVNRVQSVDEVHTVTDAARRAGFDSINYDLIYGLPLQTPLSVEVTMEEVCRLRPDRIALYAYAHVPWIKPGQRRFTESDLPTGADKRALYELGRSRLSAAGYREIGMDHFALETDSLWQAQRAGTLHRNFMGYASGCSLPVVGLGVSSIGDAEDAYAQNDKDLQRYQERVHAGQLPLQRGHLLTAEDRILRRHILRLMTRFETRWDQSDEETAHLRVTLEHLAEPAADGLVELRERSCRVTERGRPFLRNICMAFDARLMRRAPERTLFSRTV